MLMVKCDRCGKVTPKKDKYYTLDNRERGTISLFGERFPSEGTGRDICEECQKSFRNWFYGGTKT